MGDSTNRLSIFILRAGLFKKTKKNKKKQRIQPTVSQFLFSEPDDLKKQKKNKKKKKKQKKKQKKNKTKKTADSTNRLSIFILRAGLFKKTKKTKKQKKNKKKQKKQRIQPTVSQFLFSEPDYLKKQKNKKTKKKQKKTK